MEPSPLRSVLQGERQTRRNDGRRSLTLHAACFVRNGSLPLSPRIDDPENRDVHHPDTNTTRSGTTRGFARSDDGARNRAPPQRRFSAAQPTWNGRRERCGIAVARGRATCPLAACGRTPVARCA